MTENTSPATIDLSQHRIMPLAFPTNAIGLARDYNVRYPVVMVQLETDGQAQAATIKTLADENALREFATKKEDRKQPHERWGLGIRA